MLQTASLSNKKIGADAIFLSTQSVTSNPQAVCRRPAPHGASRITARYYAVFRLARRARRSPGTS